MSALEIIGVCVVLLLAGVVGAFLFDVVEEAIRAARQTLRILRTVRGHDWRRKVSARTVVGMWWKDMGSRYTTVEIAGYKFPHDPSQPVKKRIPG